MDALVNGGNALAALAELQDAPERLRLLEVAVAAYQAALTVEQDAAVRVRRLMLGFIGRTV